MQAKLANVIRRSLGRHGIHIGRADPTRSLDHWLVDIVFRELRINCVLDVGAHFGEFGQQLRCRGYQGYICSFEPVSESIQVLRQAIDRDSKWRAYPYALGSLDGSADIRVTRGSNYSSFRTPNEDSAMHSPAIVTARTETVALRRLDSVFDEVVGSKTARVYLKVDTQGWDLEVLRGASGCIDRILAGQSELAAVPLYAGTPMYPEVITYWQEMGFVPSNLFPILFDASLRLIEFDCVMVRQSTKVR